MDDLAALRNAGLEALTSARVGERGATECASAARIHKGLLIYLRSRRQRVTKPVPRSKRGTGPLGGLDARPGDLANNLCTGVTQGG